MKHSSRLFVVCIVFIVQLSEQLGLLQIYAWVIFGSPWATIVLLFVCVSESVSQLRATVAPPV